MKYVSTIDKMEEFEKLSEYAKKSVIEAFDFVRNSGGGKVDPIHVFIGILMNNKNIATRLLSKLGVDVDRTKETLILSAGPERNGVENIEVFLSEETKEALVEAFVIASEMGHVYVGTEHILLSILKIEDLDFVKDLSKVGLDHDTVLNALMNFATYHQGVFTKDDDDFKMANDPQKQSSLSTFAQDMNQLAINGRYMPVYGRNDEVERMIHILSRKTKSNPILVGEAGVGKTAIVEGLVQRIISGDVPDSFRHKRIVNLDVAGILAGAKIRGDIEERIIAIMGEASQDNNIILFIDEIHMIIGAGSTGQGAMDIANILKPYLTNSQISVIGATTLNEYQKYFETDSALVRRFQPIIVDEITVDEAIKVLDNIRPKLENYHGIRISEEAVIEAVKLSSKFITDRFLPDKAIDILDEAAAGKKISGESKNTKNAEVIEEYEKVKKEKVRAIRDKKMKEAAEFRKQEKELKAKIDKKTKVKKNVEPLSKDDVRLVVSKFAKVASESMNFDTVKSLINLEKSLEKNVIGQPDAVNRVSTAIRRARVGIGDSGRPLASFMFLGPTGVGKSELAKTVAKELFGSEEALIQIDMSEYMEQHSVSKLIGSPPGYIGFQEGGQLTEKIRRRPYSVILFDEVEKAHPELLNILLQVLEDGNLKDGKGRVINFKNTIIILTSNIGAEEVTNDKVLGFSLDNDSSDDVNTNEKAVDEAFEGMRTHLMEELKNTLRPELLNRIDDIIVFRGLGDSDIVKIVKLEIDKLNDRLREKNVSVAVSQSAITLIATKGANKEYGARNIKRKIQELIENPLAQIILERNLIELKQMQVVKVGKGTSGLKLELV